MLNLRLGVSVREKKKGGSQMIVKITGLQVTKGGFWYYYFKTGELCW